MPGWIQWVTGTLGVLNVLAIGYAVLDKWAHRAEARNPSLQVQIDQLVKEMAQSEGRAETLRRERARAVTSELKRFDAQLAREHERITEQQERVGLAIERLVKLEAHAIDMNERMNTTERLFDGIRATVDRRIAQQPREDEDRRRP